MRGYSSSNSNTVNPQASIDVNALDKDSCIRYLSMWPTGHLAESIKRRLKQLGVPQSVYTQHEYVDLGLPSGTLWATKNIGALLKEDPGDFFSWGETAPKKRYTRRNYKYQKEYLFKNTYNKYDSAVDNLTSLLEEDDAATVQWGPLWHTPSFSQWDELMKECKILNAVKNTFNSFSDDNKMLRILGPNGNQVSFPIEGYMQGEDIFSYSCYLSSSMGVAMVSKFFGIRCASFDSLSYNRHCGFIVRPVRLKSDNH